MENIRQVGGRGLGGVGCIATNWLHAPVSRVATRHVHNGRSRTEKENEWTTRRQE